MITPIPFCDATPALGQHPSPSRVEPQGYGQGKPGNTLPASCVLLPDHAGPHSSGNGRAWAAVRVAVAA